MIIILKTKPQKKRTKKLQIRMIHLSFDGVKYCAKIKCENPHNVNAVSLLYL